MLADISAFSPSEKQSMIQFPIRIYFVKLKKKQKSNSACNVPILVPADYSCNNTNVQEVTKTGLERGILGSEGKCSQKGSEIDLL